jgi:hypothetical protein
MDREEGGRRRDESERTNVVDGESDKMDEKLLECCTQQELSSIKFHYVYTLCDVVCFVFSSLINPPPLLSTLHERLY